MTFWARVTVAVFFLSMLANGMPRSPQQEIEKRQSELQGLRDQIKALEIKMDEQQRKETATLELLDSYDKKASLIKTLLTKLRREEKSIQTRVDSTRSEMKVLEDQLTFLKAQYANYVRSMYKSGRMHEIDLLLSSNSINQFYIRAEYFRRFAGQRRDDARRIGMKKAEIGDVQNRLQLQLAEERRLIAEKGTEEDRLALSVSERKDVLLRIRKDRKLVQRQMDRQMKAAKELEGLIENLIVADKVRKEKEAEEVSKGVLPQPPVITGVFESRKGQLRWPVTNGAVVAKFGNQRHPTLGTVTQNNGVDIAVESGSQVAAVAEGEVSAITWLPSYGNVIIINHYNGYRTVATHLAQIFVVVGQKVFDGTPLGESGESLEGPRVHFEIWKDREKQNPEVWLAKQ